MRFSAAGRTNESVIMQNITDMKTKRCFNYFTIADFEREERWLNEMSRRGWNFVSTNGLIYRFEAGQAGEYLY